MNLTEDEAKQRWCPFAQVGFGTRFPGVINRLQITDQDKSGQTVASGETIIPAGAKCLGSACMAWRQAPTPPRKFMVTTRDGEAAREYSHDPTGHVGYETATVIELPPTIKGRCGLAG